MLKLVVVWDPIKGLAVPDGKAEVLAESWIDGSIHQRELMPGEDPRPPGPKVVSIGQETVINAFRLAVAHGKLKGQEIAFKVGEQILQINDDGSPATAWPPGFCNLVNKQCRELNIARSKRSVNSSA